MHGVILRERVSPSLSSLYRSPARRLWPPHHPTAHARSRSLASDVPDAAAHFDPNLVNGWGLAPVPTTPWWVANNRTDVDALQRRRRITALVVHLAGGATGMVFTATPPVRRRPDGAPPGRPASSSPARTARSSAGAAVDRTRASPSTARARARSTRGSRSPATAGQPALRDRLPQRRVDVFDAAYQPVTPAGASSTRSCRPASRRSTSRRSASASS